MRHNIEVRTDPMPEHDTVADLTASQTSIDTLEGYAEYSAAAWAACETVKREAADEVESRRGGQ